MFCCWCYPPTCKPIVLKCTGPIFAEFSGLVNIWVHGIISLTFVLRVQGTLLWQKATIIFGRGLIKKGKGSPYSITEVPELIPVLGSQPAGDVSHEPDGRLPLLSARPAVTPATLKRAATNFACLVNRGTRCVNSLPKTVTRQRRDCDLNPGLSAPESSTLTTRLPSHPLIEYSFTCQLIVARLPAVLCDLCRRRLSARLKRQPRCLRRPAFRCCMSG